MDIPQKDIPDYSKYNILELYDILDRIEKEKYPEKVKAIKDEIEIKKLIKEYPYYRLFKKDKVVYNSKFFIWSLLILSAFLLLDSMVGILFGRLISILYIGLIITVLVLVLNNNEKQKTAIKIYGVVLMIPASFKLLALFLLTIIYLINSSAHNLQRINNIIFSGNLSFPIMLITFSFGLYYLLSVEENIMINEIEVDKNN